MPPCSNRTAGPATAAIELRQSVEAQGREELSRSTGVSGHCAERRWRLYVLRNLLVAAQGTSNLRRCKNGWLALPPELPPDGAGLAQTNWAQGASAFAVMSIRST